MVHFDLAEILWMKSWRRGRGLFAFRGFDDFGVLEEQVLWPPLFDASGESLKSLHT
jgi:hypothetical protein